MIRVKQVKPVKKTKKISDKIMDSAWSNRVRDDAKGKCEYCGSASYPNAHHIFSRRNWNTRWDLDNGVCLCAKHHTFSTEFSAHLTPMEFADWIRDKRGLSWYESLKSRKMINIKKSGLDKAKILADLRLRYENL